MDETNTQRQAYAILEDVKNTLSDNDFMTNNVSDKNDKNMENKKDDSYIGVNFANNFVTGSNDNTMAYLNFNGISLGNWFGKTDHYDFGQWFPVKFLTMNNPEIVYFITQQMSEEQKRNAENMNKPYYRSAFLMGAAT